MCYCAQEYGESERPMAEQNDGRLTPFDFIKSVSFSKEDLLASKDPEVEKQYNAYIVNRGFSYFQDSILHANEMNMRHALPSSAQYYYYMNSLRKRNRFSKWHKSQKDEDLDLIQKVYQVRRDIAKDYAKILKDSDLEKLRALTDQGGSAKNK